jgi:hypothetical protein
MRDDFGVCTNDTDPNHDEVMLGCPVTCAEARGECPTTQEKKPAVDKQLALSAEVTNKVAFPVPAGTTPVVAAAALKANADFIAAVEASYENELCGNPLGCGVEVTSIEPASDGSKTPIGDTAAAGEASALGATTTRRGLQAAGSVDFHVKVTATGLSSQVLQN